jgi:4-amino-4-deoxy-L-arabinose transferase-like glycosyltransferase
MLVHLSSRPETVLEQRWTLWIISILTIILFFTTNLPWQLDDYDQAKQAFTSFEMIKQGHWLYQRTPHERVASKPPLAGWFSAGCFAITRSWDIAWRLPSLLAAGAVSVLLFRAVKSAYGAAAAVVALSAFSLNLLTPRLATLVRTDMPLAFFIFTSGLLIWQKIRRHEPWNFRDRLFLFVLLTTGMLIKGPILYAFLLPGIALFQWRRRKTGAVSGWPGWWPWIGSLAVFLLWVVGGIELVPQFYDQVVVREFLGRFGTTMHHPKQLYFYLPHLLHKFAPWSVLIFVLAWLHLRAGQTKIRTAFNRISPEMLWLVCWSLGGLILMSLIPSKRVDRIFPVVPPLCLLLGAEIGKAPVSGQLRPWFYRWTVAALFLSMLFTSCYTGGKIVSGYRDHRDALVRFGTAVRDAATQHHWRYEVVPVRDEGMLLYLQKLHFIQPDRAIAEWNRGAMDALVVPAEEAVMYLGRLRGATLSPLQSTEKKDERGKNYLLLTRGQKG